MKQFLILTLLFSNMAFSTEQAPSETKRLHPVQDSVRCTMEYDPSICTYLDISAEGSNRCFARAALQSYANAHQITIDPRKVVCTSGI